MKKNGFTLAEVLITLAIIGVVATMTLPALLTNTGEQQAKTAMKKGINTLTEAAQMNSAISGFDYSGVSENNVTDQESQSLYGLLTNRASVDFRRTGYATDSKTGYTGAQKGGATGNFCVYLRDGASILFPAGIKANDDLNKNGVQRLDDGLPRGLSVVYDTNGAKKPNILSNCKGEALGGNDNTWEDSTNIADCNDKAKRVIQDQFGVRLRGSYVVPNGAAARWAFEN